MSVSSLSKLRLAKANSANRNRDLLITSMSKWLDNETVQSQIPEVKALYENFVGKWSGQQMTPELYRVMEKEAETVAMPIVKRNMDNRRSMAHAHYEDKLNRDIEKLGPEREGSSHPEWKHRADSLLKRLPEGDPLAPIRLFARDAATDFRRALEGDVEAKIPFLPQAEQEAAKFHLQPAHVKNKALADKNKFAKEHEDANWKNYLDTASIDPIAQWYRMNRIMKPELPTGKGDGNAIWVGEQQGL